MKKINFHGDSKVINYIVDCINWFIDNHSVSTLDDVTLTNISNGQILKYDSTTHKFINDDESGGTEVEANPQGQPTDTLSTIDIDGTIYEVGETPNDSTITIQKNGTDVESFSLNQSSNETINITMNKSDVGLSNVDNTSDVDKPISTATQTALNAKANTADLGTASTKNFTTSVTQGSNDIVTSGAVYNEFANLPKPEIFKGTLGVNGTITSLPTASSDNEGWEYKVITAGIYAGQPAKYGDTFISDGTQWVYIPSGDETDTDTWRGINVNGSQLLGNGISSGNVNFKSGTNAQVSGSGNNITVDVDTIFTDASSRVNIASGDSLKTILGKIKKWFTDLKTVAFSGSYNDLSNTPTIPTVNNGTLKIQKNGSNVATFSANQSGNATANIVVPTKTSELTNDSGYISDIPFTVIDGKLCLKYVKG